MQPQPEREEPGAWDWCPSYQMHVQLAPPFSPWTMERTRRVSNASKFNCNRNTRHQGAGGPETNKFEQVTINTYAWNLPRGCIYIYICQQPIAWDRSPCSPPNAPSRGLPPFLRAIENIQIQHQLQREPRGRIPGHPGALGGLDPSAPHDQGEHNQNRTAKFSIATATSTRGIKELSGLTPTLSYTPQGYGVHKQSPWRPHKFSPPGGPHAWQVPSSTIPAQQGHVTLLLLQMPI